MMISRSKRICGPQMRQVSLEGFSEKGCVRNPILSLSERIYYKPPQILYNQHIYMAQFVIFCVFT